MKVLVIGGVAAGTKAAAKCMREDRGAEVLIVTKGEDISYAGCGLPYYVGGLIESREELIVNTPQKYEGLTGVKVHTGVEAEHIDFAGKKVQAKRVSTGEVLEYGYDKLIIATGASPVVPPIPGAGLPGVFQMRTPDDAIELRKYIQENNCKKVLYITGKRNGYVTDERLLGMEELSKEMGLTMLICEGNFSELLSRNITLKYGQDNDVVVCASDLMAIGAMKALTEMDIFRPVCGFDGIILMGYVGKQMNTVRQNFAEISAAAMEELQRLMNGGKGRRVETAYSLARMKYMDIIC